MKFGEVPLPRTFGDAAPDVPSVDCEIAGRTLTALPARAFCKSTSDSSPTPPWLTTVAAVAAAKNRGSSTKECPPGLVARNNT